MSALTDRASILRAYLRLLNADSTDPDMIEHDNSTLEGAYHLLQMGVWDAQRYLIQCGAGSRWARTSSTLSFSGTAPDRFCELPSDLLRLDGDDTDSALRTSAGVTWGRLVPYAQRFRHWGNGYYVRGDVTAEDGSLRLYLTRGAAPPADLVADYLVKHATLADATTVDFDEQHRDLIPTFAAWRASQESWFAGGPEQVAKIERKLMFEKNEAWRSTRYSRQPKKVPVRAVLGDRWY